MLTACIYISRRFETDFPPKKKHSPGSKPYRVCWHPASIEWPRVPHDRKSDWASSDRRRRRQTHPPVVVQGQASSCRGGPHRWRQYRRTSLAWHRRKCELSAIQSKRKSSWNLKTFRTLASSVSQTSVHLYRLPMPPKFQVYYSVWKSIQNKNEKNFFLLWSRI